MLNVLYAMFILDSSFYDFLPFLIAFGIVMGIIFAVLIWMALIRFVKLAGNLNRFFDDLSSSNTSLARIVKDRTYMLSVLSEIEKTKFENPNCSQK